MTIEGGEWDPRIRTRWLEAAYQWKDAVDSLRDDLRLRVIAARDACDVELIESMHTLQQGHHLTKVQEATFEFAVAAESLGMCSTPVNEFYDCVMAPEAQFSDMIDAAVACMPLFKRFAMRIGAEQIGRLPQKLLGDDTAGDAASTAQADVRALAIGMAMQRKTMTDIATSIGVRRADLYEKEEWAELRNLREQIAKVTEQSRAEYADRVQDRYAGENPIDA